MRRGERTPEDIDRPPGNSLVENYDVHDRAEAQFLADLDESFLRLEAVPWGIDRRGEADESGVIYDDRTDFKLVDESGDLVALVDVKSKTSDRWLGQFNARHLQTYRERSSDLGVPAFVVMYLIPDDVDGYVDRFVYDTMEVAFTSDEDSYVSRFPDNNHKAVVPHRSRRTWTWFEAKLARTS